MKGYLLCLFTMLCFVCGTSAQSNPDSLFNIAEKEAYKGHYAEAKHILVNLVSKYDSDSDYKVFYGSLLSWMGKYDTSKAILRQVISRQPENLDAYEALTDVELWSKDDSMAIIDCNKALLLPKVKPEAYQIKIAEATKNLKKFPEAYALTDTMLAKNPGDTSARNMKFEIAAAVLQKKADSLFDSALHSSYRKQFIPAEKIAIALVKEYPNNSDYKILWCRLLGYRGKADTSEIMLREIIAKEPNNIEAYDAYADDELVTLRFKHSEELCDTGIGLPVKGDRTYLVITKASAQDNLEDYYNALTTLDTLVKRQPKMKEATDMYALIKLHIRQHQADSMFALAQKQAERKHYDSAHKNDDTIIKWFPARMDYQVFKGRLLSWQGKYDSAFKVLGIVIKKDPHNMDAYDALTDAELWKKDYPLCVNDCDQALADSMFVKFPSMKGKKDTMRGKTMSKNDSLKHDSTVKAWVAGIKMKHKSDSLHQDSITRGLAKAPKPIPDSLLSDSARARMAKDTEAHKYYSIFMLKRAHAFYDMDKMKDYQQTVNTLDTMRKVDSTNKEANDLLTEAKIKLLKNMVQAGYLLNCFSGNPPYGPWHYTWLEYIRNIPACPIGAKATFGSIYGLPTGYRRGVQLALEAFPKIIPGTYADVEIAHSNDFPVFPQWQITFNVYQKLGAGFEASLGGIYMHFIDVIDSPATAPQDVWILDPSIGYYKGDHWLFNYKPYFTYKSKNIYVVHTIMARHIFQNSDTWVSIYGSYGQTPFVDFFFPSPIPTTVKYVGADYQTRLPHNFIISAMLSYEYEEWYPPTSLWTNMYYIQFVLSKRF